MSIRRYYLFIFFINLIQIESSYAIYNSLVDLKENLPFVVKIKVDDRFGYCSGTLIAPHHVVTAAHCMYLLDSNKKIIVAPSSSITIGFGNDAKSASTGVIKLKIHPKFSLKTPFLYDIAILTLAPLTGIKPTDISSKSIQLSAPYILSGYGNSKTIKRRYQGWRQYGYLHLTGFDLSKNVLIANPVLVPYQGGPHFPSGQNCAGRENDSGGALLDDQHKLAGIYLGGLSQDADSDMNGKDDSELFEMHFVNINEPSIMTFLQSGIAEEQNRVSLEW